MCRILQISLFFGRRRPLQLVVLLDGCHPRQTINTLQSKSTKEVLGRCVQIRPSQFVASSSDANQIPFHQLSKDFTTAYAPDGLDVGSQHRLTKRDHGKGLHGRSGQPCLAGDVLQAAYPTGEVGPRQQLIAARNTFHAKRLAGLVVQLVQPTYQRTRFGSVGKISILAELAARQRLSRQKQHGLQPLQPMIAELRPTHVLHAVLAAGPRPQTHVAHPRRHTTESAAVPESNAFQLLGCRRRKQTHRNDYRLKTRKLVTRRIRRDAIEYDIASFSNNPDLITRDMSGKGVDRPVASSGSTSENRR